MKVIIASFYDICKMDMTQSSGGGGGTGCQHEGFLKNAGSITKAFSNGPYCPVLLQSLPTYHEFFNFFL